MGNAQSAEASQKLAKPQRTPNKLSKPKTNTHSASTPSTPSRRNSQVQAPALPLPPLPLSSIRPPNTRNSTFSIIEGAVSVLEEEEAAQKEEPKKKRNSIFRSKSSQKSIRSVKITAVEPEVPDATPAERWSRSNSITHELLGDESYSPNPVDVQPAPNPRLSFLNRQSYTHQSRLSLVVEQTTPLATPSIASDEGSKRFSKLWGVGKQETQTSAPPSPLAERPEAEPTVYAPIRRRSLLTPGIATRSSYVEPTSRELLPSQVQAPSTSDQLRRYYHGPRKSAPPPLDHLPLPSPEFADDAPGPRALTPSEQGYGHIGAFQLGSLRITNGAASPTPSDNRSFTMGGEEDYLTTGDRKASFESSRSRHTHRRSNTLTVTTEIIKPPWIIRSESPLRQEQIAPEKAQPTVQVTSYEAVNTTSDQSLSLFDFRSHHSPTSSQDLANEYMQDLALSPFSFEDSPPRSPQLIVSSKQNAMEDDLFAPDCDVTPMEAPLPSTSVDSGYQAGPPVPAKIPMTKELAPKPLAKADSGYSSNVSLRSFKSTAPDVPAKEAPPTPPKESRPRMSSFSQSKSSITSTESDKTIRPRHSLPATPLKDELPSMPVRQAPSIPTDVTMSRTVTAPILPRKSAEQRWAAAETRAQTSTKQRQSLPTLTTPYQPTDSPTGSDKSNSSASSKRKSAKPQPARPIFTIQAHRSISDDLSIPPVSTQAARQLEERVSGFPVASFPNTVASRNLRPSVSKETLGTILSVGSVEQREERTTLLDRYYNPLPAVPDQSPQVSNVPAAPAPEMSRRYTYQAPVVQTAPVPMPKIKSRHSLQDPVLTRKTSDFELQLSSFENISSSLGKSPYDHALGAVSNPSLTANLRTQISTAQLEADARERFHRGRRSSDRSESDLRRTPSYGSFTNRSMHAGSRSTSRERSKSGDRSKSRERLPEKTEEAPPMPKALSVEDINRYAVPRKAKGQPPVSMQTQRSSPVPRNRSVPNQVGQRTGTPNRTAPAPPNENQSPDPWAAQRNYWAEQKQSAQEALQQVPRGRKSMDAQPRTTPKLQTRKSMDAPRSRPRMSLDSKSSNISKKPALSHHSSFEQAKQQWRYESGYDYGGQLTLDMDAQYDHGYGTATPEPQQAEYYEPSTAQENLDYPTTNDGPRPQPIHSNSTSDMLVLDRYAGGFGYGFERDSDSGRHGIVGSAGTKGAVTKGSRKSMRMSMDYGVDFSDVPIFVTTAPLR
ncbi:hypothetical protein PVAG01_11202 [Phlyctema vagabunda]|uniref:Proteophosphoglycan ppg4 n=1 Tax=Phlyctema vagabunda TaxID=108571 RepID=A0ABR4P201_9HELO